MDGKGHTMIAPVFSVGTSWLCVNMGLLNWEMDKVLTIGAIGAISLLSCKWADADLLALKPTPIITGTAKKRYSKKYGKEFYYVSVSRKTYETKFKSRKTSEDNKVEFTRTGRVYIYYENCSKHSPVMTFFALLFKSMGLKVHRGWQSHSPLVWVPIWGVLLWLANMIPYYGQYLSLIVAGLAFGYWSHIFGDLWTKDGAPLLPPELAKRLQKIPIVGILFQDKLQPVGGSIHIGKYKFKINSAKASNIKWTYFVIFVMINIFSYFLVPNLFYGFWGLVGKLLSLVWVGLKYLWEFVVIAFKGGR